MKAAFPLYRNGNDGHSRGYRHAIEELRIRRLGVRVPPGVPLSRSHLIRIITSAYVDEIAVARVLYPQE